MVDVDKLKKKISEKRMNVKTVAEQIGIDESTLYRKLNANGMTLTVGEVYKIIDALGISKKEAESIFFSKKLA